MSAEDSVSRHGDMNDEDTDVSAGLSFLVLCNGVASSYGMIPQIIDRLVNMSRCCLLHKQNSYLRQCPHRGSRLQKNVPE